VASAKTAHFKAQSPGHLSAVSTERIPFVSRFHTYLVVIIIAAVVMLTNLGGPRLWDRDEPRNAGCAAEMMAHGDWVVPVFNAEMRTHKPVLLYWLMIAAYSAFGVNEFAARFPSALLTIGTALCTCEMGRRLFSQRAGMWAGIVIATSLMLVVAGRAATPDATLIFCSTLAMTLFVGAIPAVSGNPNEGCQVNLSWSRAMGIFGAMGLAALAKGPVGILLPTATIALFQVISARRNVAAAPDGWRERFLDFASKFVPKQVWKAAWQLRPITALLVTLAVAAPWYIWVGIRTDGEFLRGFFLEHNLGRALNTMEGHRGNVLFYPLTLLIGMFPWSVFAVPLIIDVTQRVRRSEGVQPGYVLALCWLVVYLGVFSVAKTKLPSYITPCYPAVAMMLGSFIDRWLAGQVHVPRIWLQAACLVLALVGLTMLIAIPLVVREKLPGEEWLGIIGLIPLVAGVSTWWLVRAQRTRSAAWCFAGAATASATLLFAVGAQRVDQHQYSHQLLEVISQRPSPRIAAYACLEPSWVFYGGRPIDEITVGEVGPTHSPYVVRRDGWVPKPKVSIDDVVASGENAVVITTGKQLAAAKKLLPNDFKVLKRVPLFLKDDELVLLGRPLANALAQRPRPSTK
jgi:4-amino-4-deoxy-L-arabinose transferase-like glycosyltransferase